jgi:SAM-dependent methyltransferase
VLDDVAGKSVLELGCGAAHSSIALARRGARPVGLDISERQLEHAQKLVADAGAPVTLVHASAESIPFRAASFDMVFSDHGAIALADPEQALAEAARVLRGRGLLAFLVPSPFTALCWNRQTGRLGSILQRPYFDIGSDDDAVGASAHQHTYGDWMRLFRAAGLTVEDLIEVRPPEGATTSFPGFASLEWARRYPAEIVWRVRKGPVRRRK